MNRNAAFDTPVVGEFFEHLAAVRSGDRQPDQRLVEAVNAHRAVLRQMLLEPAHVIDLRGRTSPRS
jgi:hypothetical protein